MHSSSSGRKRLLQFALSFLVLFFGTLTHAQGASAKLSGTVVDGQGKAVANALVTVRGEGISKTTRADANGSYSFDGLPAGTYVVEATASGFSSATKGGVSLAAGQSQQIDPLPLTIASVAEQITVNAGVDSIAAETAPSGGFVEERSAQSLISDTYVENFTSPIADFGEIVQIVPGTFTTSSDGSRTRPKQDLRSAASRTATYDIDFDGIPFYDTNTPTHHSWAFFPAQWIGGVDFDRSPGYGFHHRAYALRRIDSPALQARSAMSRTFAARHLTAHGTPSSIDGAYNSGNFGFFGGPARVQPVRRRSSHDVGRLPDLQLQHPQRRLAPVPVLLLAQDRAYRVQRRHLARCQHLRLESDTLPDARTVDCQSASLHLHRLQLCLTPAPASTS